MGISGIAYALAEAMDAGHGGLPLDEPLPLAETLLEIPAETVEAEESRAAGSGPGRGIDRDRPFRENRHRGWR